MFLVLTNVTPESWCAKLADKHAIIGRSVSAQIQIPAQFRHVSRRHAQIWIERNVVWLLDLQSRLGTRVNGVRLKANEAQRIFPGDRIRLGELELQLTDSVSAVAQVRAALELQDPHVKDHDETEGSRNGVEPVLCVKIGQLSPTELEILLWLCRGYTDDKEIALALHRSPNTVRTHMMNIFSKLGVHSRAELVGLLRRVELKSDRTTDHD